MYVYHNQNFVQLNELVLVNNLYEKGLISGNHIEYEVSVIQYFYINIERRVNQLNRSLYTCS